MHPRMHGEWARARAHALRTGLGVVWQPCFLLSSCALDRRKAALAFAATDWSASSWKRITEGAEPAKSDKLSLDAWIQQTDRSRVVCMVRSCCLLAFGDDRSAPHMDSCARGTVYARVFSFFSPCLTFVCPCFELSWLQRRQKLNN
jgi:hypothetical protein